jgi:hypothetical protein
MPVYMRVKIHLCVRAAVRGGSKNEPRKKRGFVLLPHCVQRVHCRKRELGIVALPVTLAVAVAVTHRVRDQCNREQDLKKER